MFGPSQGLFGLIGSQKVQFGGKVVLKLLVEGLGFQATSASASWVERSRIFCSLARFQHDKTKLRRKAISNPWCFSGAEAK